MTQQHAHAPSSSRSSGWQWPAMIVGLLLLNVGVCAVTIVAATTTQPEIEEDYYRKALEWDEHRAELAAQSAAGSRGAD